MEEGAGGFGFPVIPEWFLRHPDPPPSLRLQILYPTLGHRPSLSAGAPSRPFERSGMPLSLARSARCRLSPKRRPLQDGQCFRRSCREKLHRVMAEVWWFAALNRRCAGFQSERSWLRSRWMTDALWHGWLVPTLWLAGQTLGFRRVQSATSPIGCHIGPSPGGRMTNNRPENVSNPSDLGRMREGL